LNKGRKKTTKLLAIVLAIVMCFGVVPVMASTSSKVVVTQEDYTPLEGEEKFGDIPAAINALGEAGGTIYVKGAVTTVEGLEDGTTTSHGLVKIVGYTGASTDSLTITTGGGTISGDITFENLTIAGGGIATHGHKVTIGDDVQIAQYSYVNSKGETVTENTTLGAAAGGMKDVFVINSGTFSDQYLLQKYEGTFEKSADWTMNGGEISSVIAGNYTATTKKGDTTIINGDITFTMNGGSIDKLYLGGYAPNNDVIQTLNGNFVYVMNGGSVANLYYGGKKKTSDTLEDKYQNVALIFNEATMEDSVTLKLDSNSRVKPSAKLSIAVLNNYELGKVTINSYAEAYMNYILHVTGGKATPVFEPSTSTFKGFTLTADNEDYKPYVGNVALEADADGLYVLEDYLSDADGKIVEIGFKKEISKIVVTQEDYSPLEGEGVYSDIPEAINVLGTKGGTIYVKGAVTTAAGLEDGTTTSHGLVTITGYTGASTDSLEIKNGNAAIYGDITFSNLKVAGGSIGTFGHTVTLGSDVVIGKYLDYKNRETNTSLGYGANGEKDIFVIDGGTFEAQHMLQKGAGTYSKSFDWTLNGGTITSLVLGNYSGAENAVSTINGDVKFTQNGGQITDLYIGSRMQNSGQQLVTGNLVYKMNDGSVTNMYYGGYKKYSGTPKDDYNNVALIFNNASMTNAVTLKQTDTSVQPTADADIIILNNYESNKVTVNDKVAYLMDYILHVTNGKAEPVFERTDANDPSTSTFKGFTLTADNKSYKPYVGNVVLEADADGLYVLEDYLSDADGKIVEIGFKKEISKIVVTQEDYSPLEGEGVYSDIPEAINVLGTKGGTIYVKGAVTTVAGLEDGTTTSHGLVTITGYTGASTDSLTITTGSNAIYGDITLENIKVKGSNIATHNHTVTFGTGVVVDSTSLGYGAYTSGTKDIFVINSGSFGAQNLLQKWSGTFNKSYDWTLNGGSISSLVLGNYVGQGAATIINGDIKFTQNGGSVTTLYLGSNMQNDVQQTVTGDFVYTMNGGEVTTMNYGGYKKYNGKVKDAYNNIALIFNNSSMTNTVTLGQTDPSVQPAANTDMIVLNNYESNKVTINDKVAYLMDYILHVTNGKAEPVFERTDANDPATSTFKGFTLTADNEDYKPYVGNVALEANAEGLYVLEDYLSDSDGKIVEIKFLNPSETRKFIGMSLSLEGQIGLNFYVSNDHLLSNDAYVTFTLPKGKTQTVAIADVKETGYGLSFTCLVPAKEMGDIVVATLYDGGEVIDTQSTSVKNYAEIIIENVPNRDDFAEAIPLAKAMLHYGAYAQKLFEYNIENLANENYASSDTVNNVTMTQLAGFAKDKQGLDDFGVLAGATLIMEGETTLRMWFEFEGTASLDDLKFTLNGEEDLEVKTSGNYHIVEIANISAKDLDKEYKVTVTAGEKTFDVTCSVMTYCYNALKNTDNEALQNAARALYLYNLEANNYFEQ